MVCCDNIDCVSVQGIVPVGDWHAYCNQVCLYYVSKNAITSANSASYFLYIAASGFER